MGVKLINLYNQVDDDPVNTGERIDSRSRDDLAEDARTGVVCSLPLITT